LIIIVRKRRLSPMEVEKILEEIKKVCKAPTKYFLGCVKDENGIPIPFTLTSVNVSGDKIIFQTPTSLPASSLIRKMPEVSISLIDIESIWKWQDPKGFQVKGLAKQTDGEFTLEIFEIYDVLPKPGIDLNVPIYRKKLIWIETKFYTKFEFDRNIKEVSLNIFNEVKGFMENLQSKGFPSFILTIDPLNGITNISPRWIVKMDTKFWVFGDGTRHKTQLNAEKPCPVSVVFLDTVILNGYATVGWLETSSDTKLKSEVEGFWKMKGIDVPAIRVNLFHPEEIYKFSRVGWTKLWEGRQRSQWLKLSK